MSFVFAYAMANGNNIMTVNIFVQSSVNIPVQPDWLFQRSSLTMDFVFDAEPSDAVSYTIDESKN